MSDDFEFVCRCSRDRGEYVCGLCARDDLAALRATVAREAEDWAETHTHLQSLCRKAGIAEERIVGDSHGVPGIMDLADLLGATVAALEKERDNLRKFVSFEPEPGPNAYAWCCHCQESHQICQPHVSEVDHNLRMDMRVHLKMEIRSLKDEVGRLVAGEHSITTLTVLRDQFKELNERLEHARKVRKEVTAMFKAAESALSESRRTLETAVGLLKRCNDRYGGDNSEVGQFLANLPEPKEQTGDAK